ncbi:MAG: pyridoxamine 5'-phosphate oxidase family protein [Chloroflexi bacterium]|nr:pyridoxamine 5'-phosphate oxidase family protein [Chloroflexota bacterium]
MSEPAKPINLLEWEEAVNKGLEEGSPCVLASADKDGCPDIAFKGSMMIFDGDHIAWWERALAEQIAQVADNPNIVMLYRNGERRLNLRFYGKAEFHKEGPMRDAIRAKVIPQEAARTPNGEGFAVAVRVDRVRANANTVQERPGA